MNHHDSAGHRPPAYPTQSWYVAATSDEVTASPLGRRALDTGPGALPHLRRHRGRPRGPRRPQRLPAQPGSRRAGPDRLVVLRLRVRRRRVLRAGADPDRDPVRRPRAFLPRARAGRPRLGLVRRAGPRRPAQAAQRAVAGRRRRGRRWATPGRPRPASCCCTRTSPTSPMSRSWTRPSRRPCCRPGRCRCSRWRSPRPASRSSAATRRRRWPSGTLACWGPSRTPSSPSARRAGSSRPACGSTAGRSISTAGPRRRSASPTP